MHRAVPVCVMLPLFVWAKGTEEDSHSSFNYCRAYVTGSTSQALLSVPKRGVMSFPAWGWVPCASLWRPPLHLGSHGMADSRQAAPHSVPYHRPPRVRCIRPVWSYSRTRDIATYLFDSLSSSLHKCHSIKADVMENQALGLMD